MKLHKYVCFSYPNAFKINIKLLFRQHNRELYGKLLSDYDVNINQLI